MFIDGAYDVSNENLWAFVCCLLQHAIQVYDGRGISCSSMRVLTYMLAEPTNK